MSLRFLTGFDYYNISQITRVWSYASGGQMFTPGRFYGQAYGYVWQSGYVSTSLPAATTYILGVALYMDQADPTNPIIVFQDATTSPTSPITQVDVRMTSAGACQFTRNGTVIATSAPFFYFGQYNYLEFKISIDSTNGYIQLRSSGEVILNTTSLNTQYTGNNYVNMVRLQAFADHTFSSSFTQKFDDVYILDTAGSVNNGFLGESRVQTQYPVANGDVNNFLPVGATQNYQCVDETISDDDLTYVKAAVVSDIDDYQMGTVSLTGTIYAVQINVTHRKDDVGSRTISPIIKSGGTYYTGNMFTCQSSYIVSQAIWELEPHTALAWSNSTVSAVNAGLKITG